MSRKILIVDDEPAILRSLSFVLEKEGFKTKTAENGMIALQKLHGFVPDLIFLDFHMPLKNGFEVCEAIRENPDLKNIYIIMLTAKDFQICKTTGHSLGINEFMSKPYSPSAVVKRVKEILPIN